MKKYIIAIAIIIGLVSGYFGYILLNKSQNLKGIPISGSPLLGSNSTVTATTTAKLWVNSNNNAQFISFSNVGQYDAWISATTTNLAANNGLWLKASSTISFFGDSLYTGGWYGIGTGTTTISILKI